MTAPWLCGDETRLVQGRPDLHTHLPVGSLAILDVSPSFQHLEAAQALFADYRPRHGVLHTIGFSVSSSTASLKWPH